MLSDIFSREVFTLWWYRILCDDVCRDRCVQTVQFTVPQVDAGPQATSLINKHGHSNSLMFTVLEAADTGESDTADESSP